jgi:hypothetical protein
MKRRYWLSFLLLMVIFTGTAIARPVTAADLVGVWKSNIQSIHGTAVVQVILKRNGTFSKTVKWRGLMTYDVGTYIVGNGFIHFKITDHDPKWYKGVSQKWVKSETIFFRMINRNRMVCEDRIMKTRWEAYRVL